MTQKDYELIARALRELPRYVNGRREIQAKDSPAFVPATPNPSIRADSGAKVRVVDLVERMAVLLGAENPRFDADIFLRKAEHPTMVKGQL